MRRPVTQSHRHYWDEKTNAFGVALARAAGLPLTAECGAIWVPGTAEQTADIPICPDCEALPTRRRRGQPRITLDVRRNYPHYVYRCYDGKGGLLYVGCTYNPPARLRQHKSEAKWFRKVASTRLIVWPNRRKALDMEKLAIQTEHPAHNVAFRAAS